MAGGPRAAEVRRRRRELAGVREEPVVRPDPEQRSGELGGAAARRRRRSGDCCRLGLVGSGGAVLMLMLVLKQLLLG